MGKQYIMHFYFLLYCSWITLFLYDGYYKLHIIMYYLRYILHLIVYNFAELSHNLDETIYYDKSIMYLLYLIFSITILFRQCTTFIVQWYLNNVYIDSNYYSITKLKISKNSHTICSVMNTCTINMYMKNNAHAGVELNYNIVYFFNNVYNI